MVLNYEEKRKKLETCGRESLGTHYQFSENVFDLFLVKILKKSYMHFRSDISMCIKVYGSANLYGWKNFFLILKKQENFIKGRLFQINNLLTVSSIHFSKGLTFILSSYKGHCIKGHVKIFR